MPYASDLGKLSQKIEDLQSRLRDANATAGDETLRRQLQTLSNEIKDRHARFLTEYQTERDRAAKQLADARRRAGGVQAQVEAVREQLAAAEAAAAARPAPPPPAPELPPIDQTFGPKLRADFLTWLGQIAHTAKSPPATDDLGEAWHDWDGTEE